MATSSSEKISFTYNQAIDVVTKELENTKVGQDAGTKITGERNIILGKETAFGAIDIEDTIIIGYRIGYNLINSSSNLVYINNNSLKNIDTDNNSIIIGSEIGNRIIYNNNNSIIGYNIINNIESNISDNIIIGSYIGNELTESFHNTIIGNYNLNEVISASNNIYIGMINTNIDEKQNNSLVIGNNNTLKHNPLIIGNNNIINSKKTIGVGNALKAYNTLINVNPLNNNDIILNNNVIASLNLSSLNVNPINNYIYQSPHNPYELSLNNNLDFKRVNVNLQYFSNNKFENDNTFMYNVLYELDENNIYRFNEPIIIDKTFTTNEINFTYNGMNKDFQIYITELPKYSHIPKRLYNFDETIILTPYSEYLNIEKDTFSVYIVINIENVSYLSKVKYDINVIRNVILDNFIIKEIYGTYIYFDWFQNTLTIDKKDSTILIDNKNVYVQNFITTSSNITYEGITENYDTSYINYLKVVNGTNININGNDITVHNITDLYTININNIWHMLSSNVFYIGEIGLEDFYIYIEQPPSYGIIDTNLIYVNSSFINFTYCILEDVMDSMTIRILNKEKTKISDTITITLKNYVINRVNKLSLQLLDDNYYMENNIIKNPNNNLSYINDSNILYIDNIINYNKQINTNIKENNININIYPFNRINLYSELINYGFSNIKESNIFILNENIENGYIIERDYINSSNKNDKVLVLIALNRFNYDPNNVYRINLNVMNEYIFEYTTQYIYDNEELLKTFNVVGHPKNKIFIDDINLDNKYINDSFNSFKVLFGDNIVNLNLEYYPTVNDFIVLQNAYWFKQDFNIAEILQVHSIEYIFDKPVKDFKISLNVFIELYEEYNIEKFKKYKFHIVLNDEIITYDETTNLKYNSTNLIIIENKTILNSFKIVYKLSENIFSENDNIINYFLKITFTNLKVEYDIDSGTNILYGEDIQCFGYENIGIGSLYNLYGNQSIVIGNKIGNDFINNSIIVGNNSFDNVIPRNVISIGNNNYNNIENSLLFDEVCSKNPIIIGHGINFNSNNIININNVIIETDTDLIIGNNKNVIINIDYENIKNKPKLLVGNYSNLTNIPNFANVAYSGNYSNLTGLPKIYSNYNEIENIPNLDLFITYDILDNCNFTNNTNVYSILDNCNFTNDANVYDILYNCNYTTDANVYSILGVCNFTTDENVYDILDNCNYMNDTGVYSILTDCNFTTDVNVYDILTDCNFTTDVNVYDILDNCNFTTDTGVYSILYDCNFTTDANVYGNYYKKSHITNNYYTKSYINTNYYTSTQVDTLTDTSEFKLAKVVKNIDNDIVFRFHKHHKDYYNPASQSSIMNNPSAWAPTISTEILGKTEVKCGIGNITDTSSDVTRMYWICSDDEMAITSFCKMTGNKPKYDPNPTNPSKEYNYINASTLATASKSSVQTMNTSQDSVSLYCSYSIWVNSKIFFTSDLRIKKNIKDVTDNEALNKLLKLKPRKYNYIDEVMNGTSAFYGFIAQEVEEILPEIVSTQVNYIPNIMILGNYNNGIITLENNKINLTVNKNIKIFINNNEEIEVIITQVIDNNNFRINKKLSINNNKVFVYGELINDFKVISKQFLHSICVSSIQDLHYKIIEQENLIKSLIARIELLENK